jgi:hypothetical protein
MPVEDLGSLRDLIAFVNQQDLPPARKRDTLSSIRRTCGLLDRSPESVPLDVSELRRLLQTIRPEAHGISHKSLSNIRSLISMALVF